MDQHQFLKLVEERLDADLEIDAADATHAVLAALAARLTHEEAMELAPELPPSFARALARATGEHAFERDAFIEDVAARLDLDDMEAENVASAILGALREAMRPSPTVEQVFELLPADLAMLIHASD